MKMAFGPRFGPAFLMFTCSDTSERQKITSRDSKLQYIKLYLHYIVYTGLYSNLECSYSRFNAWFIHIFDFSAILIVMSTLAVGWRHGHLSEIKCQKGYIICFQ